MRAAKVVDEDLDESSSLGQAVSEASPARPLPERASGPRPARRALSLHVSKLRGITYELRGKLKQRSITYADQLLDAAGHSTARRRLAAAAAIEDEVLARLVCRADLARIKGVGAIFADMLELIGVDRVSRLARQDPEALHATLYQLNVTERFARRAPTPEEVASWIAQARALPPRVEED